MQDDERILGSCCGRSGIVQIEVKWALRRGFVGDVELGFIRAWLCGVCRYKLSQQQGREECEGEFDKWIQYGLPRVLLRVEPQLPGFVGNLGFEWNGTGLIFGIGEIS